MSPSPIIVAAAYHNGGVALVAVGGEELHLAVEPLRRRGGVVGSGVTSAIAVNSVALLG